VAEIDPKIRRAFLRLQDLVGEQPVTPRLSESDVAKVVERAHRATEGPWRYELDDNPDYSAFGTHIAVGPYGRDKHVVGTYSDWGDQAPTPDDMDFIAHARADVPALAHEWRRLRAALSQIQEGFINGHDLARADMMRIAEEALKASGS